MKIGIITFHNIPNIGAILQAQSLCQYIRSLGLDCEIIDYTCDNLVDRELTFHPSSNFLRNILLKLAWRKNEAKIAACNDYVRRLGLLSKEQYDRHSIYKANEVYDVFLSGSDMIWNLKVTNADKSFFLDFAKKSKKCISYASSIGDNWTQEETKIVLPLLTRYRALSVREADTNNYLKSLGLSSEHVADPTMLVPSVEWKNQLSGTRYKNYVLVYFPSDNLLAKAKQYAKRYSKQIIVISQGLPIIGVRKISPNTPNEWLGLIYYADAIFTNSYHGLLFALYFEKSVWTANYGNRITSLLTQLGINECRVDKDVDLSYSIDYENCKKRMSQFRTFSQSYLNRALFDNL